MRSDKKKQRPQRDLLLAREALLSFYYCNKPAHTKKAVGDLFFGPGLNQDTGAMGADWQGIARSRLQLACSC